MRFLLRWSVRVAKGDDAEHSARLTEGGRPIVEVSISLQGIPRDSNQRGVIFTTA